MNIRSVGILGAGTMGAQIALHFANAGVPSLLLDVTARGRALGLERARKLKPDPQFTPDTWRLVRTGGFDEDLSQLTAADWIMEAVVERLDVKRDLLARVAPHCAPHAVLSTNTSGIPIGAISDGWPLEFRRRWLGTHFFNPPRYLPLLELIPTPDTDPAIVAAVSAFADHVLGKGVVVARDTPNFIANHLALHGVAAMLRAVESGAYTIDEIDAITGSPIGRPPSATFRTAGHRRPRRARAGHAQPRGTAARGRGPGLVCALAAAAAPDRGRGPGREIGPGLLRAAQGRRRGLGDLDPQPGQLRVPSRSASRCSRRSRAPRPSPTSARACARCSWATTTSASSCAGHWRRRCSTPRGSRRPSRTRSTTWTGSCAGASAGSSGPFELLDAIGLREVTDAAAAHGVADVPPMVAEALAAGRNRLRDGALPPAGPGLLVLTAAVAQSKVVKRNAGASLVDLGDGVLCVEFHSKMNSIGADTIAMLQAGVSEAETNFRALVVGNEAPNFSAGANLMLVLLEAQEGNWDELDLMVRGFQQGVMALRYSQVPVVVAPAGLALGGGCEIALHGDRVHAAGETFMGLVEVGVGLIPAGGGTKEMLARAMARVPSSGADPLPYVQQAFETVALAKVSASGPDASRLGYLSPLDTFSMNRERLIADAKAKALQRVSDGYRAPLPRLAIPVGGESLAAALKLGVHLAWRAGRASDHDLTIGRALAQVFAGGAVPHATTVSEQHLLDLEREAFLRLLGEPKTLARIQHTLTTGKPLRN